MTGIRYVLTQELAIMSKIIAICYLVFIWGCFISCLLKTGVDYHNNRYHNIPESLCELSNIEYREYVCVDDEGKSARHCYVGNATWIITDTTNISPAPSPLIQEWDKGFVPSIGTKRKCWYYDDKISLTSPKILAKNELGVKIIITYIILAIAIFTSLPTGPYLENTVSRKELHAKTN